MTTDTMALTDRDKMLMALDHHMGPMWEARATYEKHATVVRAFLEAMEASADTVDAILGGDMLLYHDWYSARCRDTSGAE